MEQIEINVTKNIEEVEINVQPNVTQVIISENIGSGIQSVQAGTNVTVDNTDPQNPIINVPDIPSGGVESVTGNIVDNTDPDNPTVNFNAGDYDLEDFNNASSDPFVRDLFSLDQDNLPIKIDLTLADLGLTEIGTDEEMNTALKAYFTANNLTVDQKQIPHIRIFDEMPSSEPLLYLEVSDLQAYADDFGVVDINNVEDWNDAFNSYFFIETDFESVEIVGNSVTLTGGQGNKLLTVMAVLFVAQVEIWDAIELRLENFTACESFTADSSNINPLIRILGMPNITSLEISANDITITKFDEGFLNWATDEAPENGNIQFSSNAEDLTLSNTWAVLDTKNWTNS
jgi:hypothetical protein